MRSRAKDRKLDAQLGREMPPFESRHYQFQDRLDYSSHLWNCIFKVVASQVDGIRWDSPCNFVRARSVLIRCNLFSDESHENEVQIIIAFLSSCSDIFNRMLGMGWRRFFWIISKIERILIKGANIFKEWLKLIWS